MRGRQQSLFLLVCLAARVYGVGTYCTWQTLCRILAKCKLLTQVRSGACTCKSRLDCRFAPLLGPTPRGKVSKERMGRSWKQRRSRGTSSFLLLRCRFAIAASSIRRAAHRALVIQRKARFLHATRRGRCPEKSKNNGTRCTGVRRR